MWLYEGGIGTLSSLSSEMDDVDMRMEAERRIRLNNQSQQMVAHEHPHRRSRWLLTQALGFWLGDFIFCTLHLLYIFYT